jgi:transposase
MTAADAILDSVFGLAETETQGRIRQLAAEYAALRIALDDERKVSERLWDVALDQQERLAELESQLGKLRAKAATNSSNSSMPPSSDKPADRACAAKERRERRRNGSAAAILRDPNTPPRKVGAQPGHQGHCRVVDAGIRPDELVVTRPETCPRCKAALDATAPVFKEPKLELVYDFDPFERRFKTIGYFRHSVKCPACKRAVFGKAPSSPFGDGLVALVAALRGRLRVGLPEIIAFLGDCAGIQISLGAAAKLCQIAAAAMAKRHEQLLAIVQRAEVVYTDETSWQNQGARGFVLLAASKQAVVFRIGSGSSHAADVDALLGEVSSDRTIVSDRGKVFDHLPTGNRQVCHCHLARNFKKLESYGGASAVLGKALLGQERELFRAWHAFRKDGDRDALQAKLAPVQAEMHNLLEAGRRSGVDWEFCQGILKVWEALWTFARRDGVEPTNNIGERALRHIVLWRQTLLETKSEWGCRFVERIETLVADCKLHGRNLLQVLTLAVRDWRAARVRRARPTKAQRQACQATISVAAASP